MSQTLRMLTAVTFVLTLVAICPQMTTAAPPTFALQKGDHICYLGNTLADRMQHHAWLETYLHAIHPTHNLTFRNLGFPGDELTTRPRSMNFGTRGSDCITLKTMSAASGP